MTMHRRPSRKGRDQQAEEFISQAAAAETVQLHCLIPKRYSSAYTDAGCAGGYQHYQFGN